MNTYYLDQEFLHDINAFLFVVNVLAEGIFMRNTFPRIVDVLYSTGHSAVITLKAYNHRKRQVQISVMVVNLIKLGI